MAGELRPDRAVVHGAGRWARVLVQELSGILPGDVPITVVSPLGAVAMQRWIQESPALSARGIEVDADLPPPAAGHEVAIAVIANRPPDHFAAATNLLDRGYHVLVEKPMTTDPVHARYLVERGQKSRRAIMAGLDQLFAPYLQTFQTLLPFPAARVTGFDLRWEDPSAEIRYGEKKQADASVGVALDVVPHAWALLRIFLGTVDAMTMELEDVIHGGAEITVRCRIGASAGRIRLSRATQARRRWLRLRTDDAMATLDFSKDPMIATIDDKLPLALPERTAGGGAIAHELRFFMELARSIHAGTIPPRHPAVGELTLEHVDLACSIEKALKDRQTEIIRSSIDRGTLETDASAAYALRALLAEPLIAAGLARNTGDQQAIETAIGVMEEKKKVDRHP